MRILVINELWAMGQFSLDKEDGRKTALNSMTPFEMEEHGISLAGMGEIVNAIRFVPTAFLPRDGIRCRRRSRTTLMRLR